MTLKLACAFVACIAASAHAQESSKAAIQSPEQIFAWTDDILDDIGSAAGVGQVDDVLSKIESAITAHPDNAMLQLAMGRALIIRDCALRGNNCSVRAKGHITRAIQLDPKLVRAHVLLAHDALNAGCLPCAIPHIETAKRLEPNNPFVLEVDGRFVDMSGKLLDAAKLYLRAIEGFSNPKKRWQSYTWLSYVYERTDDYDRAEWALKHAVESRPRGAWSHGNLGTFYIFTRGDYDKAIPELQSALAQMNYGRAREGLALSLYERWGAAYLRKTDKKTLDAYLAAAVAEYPDKETMLLISARYSGTGRAARALLDSKEVSPKILERQWENGRTPLLMAAWNDNTDLALSLLNHGAYPDALDRVGVTPAYIVVKQGNLRVLRALAKKGANLKFVSSTSKETLLIAVSNMSKKMPDRLKIAALLVDAGVPLDHQDSYKNTALGAAVFLGKSVELVRYLLSRGARADILMYQDLTPPALAIMQNDRKMLQAFIERKAGLDTKVQGHTLAEYARIQGHPELAELLVGVKR
jgi:ankyrin repeat protein